MNRDYIQFKKQRELGETISVTFQFLRVNYKSFFKLLFKIAGPVLVLLVAAVGYYSYSTLGSSLTTSIFDDDGGFLISFGILMLVLLVYFAVLNGMVYHFVKSYIRNEGTIDEAEISRNVRRDFGKLLGLSAITWLLIFAGFMLFIIPGIYLGVPLSIAAAALVFKNESISGSISEAFYLVKDNWWMSFITLFVIWLIVYVISMVFQLPLIIYTFIKAFTVAKEGSAADFSGIFDWVYLSLSIVSSLIQYILYSITPIGVAFVYFHLDEKKNFTGTYETIENLGKNN